MATARSLHPDVPSSAPGNEPARPLPEERRRHLRVVRAGEKSRSAFRFRLTPRAGIVVTILLFVALFAVAASHALLIESQGRLDRLDQQVADAQSRYEDLQVQVATMESPPRVIEEAKDLGMEEPSEVDWVSQSQPVGEDDEGDGDPESSDTSYPDVKPYLDSTTP